MRWDWAMFDNFCRFIAMVEVAGILAGWIALWSQP